MPVEPSGTLFFDAANLPRHRGEYEFCYVQAGSMFDKTVKVRVPRMVGVRSRTECAQGCVVTTALLPVGVRSRAECAQGCVVTTALLPTMSVNLLAPSPVVCDRCLPAASASVST